MVASRWSLWQHGGHVLGGLATGYIMACLLKQSEKKSGSRSGYRLNFLALPFVISLRKSEFSWYTAAPKFGGLFFSFPVSEGSSSSFS